MSAREEEERQDREDERLVARFKAGENDAFGTLYSHYFERLLNYLNVTLNDREAAEDIAQTVFTNALEALPRYELRGRPFRSWLFAIARNATIDHLRKESGVEPMDPEELTRMIDREHATEEELLALSWIADDELLMLVERISLVQRQVLALHYLLDLPYAEIARILDRTPDSVRSLQKRTIAFLRERLTALGREPGTDTQKATGTTRQATVLRARRFSISRKSRM